MFRKIDPGQYPPITSWGEYAKSHMTSLKLAMHVHPLSASFGGIFGNRPNTSHRIESARRRAWIRSQIKSSIDKGRAGK